MLNKRQREILHLLEETEDYVTIETLANNCSLSKRTIYTELNIIALYLKQKGGYLEKKPGVGVSLKKQEQNHFNEQVTVPAVEDDANDIMARRMEIMRRLLFEKEALTYQFLSDLFLVSKTSIVKDLEFVMSILGVDSSITLIKARRGSYLKGTELDVQMALLQFNRFVMKHSEIYSSEMLHQNIDVLSQYYGSDIIKACQNIFYAYIRKHSSAIADHYVQNVLNSLIILVYRSSRGYHHDPSSGQGVTEKFFEESSKIILNKLALRLKISFTDADREFFSKYLISNRFEATPQEKQFDDFTKRLLQAMTTNLKINFLTDTKLVKQLTEHIPPMMYRLQSHMTVENPFTNQIKNEFSLIFNLISMVIVEIESDYQVVFNENEIAFLTIYFQSAIEGAKINKHILVVCQMGMATSELLVNRIKKILPSIDSLELSSVAELEYLKMDDYDFIISTVHLTIPQKKVILVSPFLTQQDVKNIKAAGYNPSTISCETKISQFHHLFSQLSEKEILLNTNFKSKDDFFKTFGNDLVKKAYVKPGFINDLFLREQLGSTDLPAGVAIPHGSPQNILKTRIFLLKNRKKIKWDKYFIDLIFVICISQKDRLLTKGILSDIYQLISNPKLLKSIRQEEQADRLIKQLQGGSEYE